MKIVMLSGKFGLVIESPSASRYVDLKSPLNAWPIDSKYFEDCWGTLERVKEVRAERVRRQEFLRGEITDYQEPTETEAV